MKCAFGISQTLLTLFRVRDWWSKLAIEIGGEFRGAAVAVCGE